MHDALIIAVILRCKMLLMFLRRRLPELRSRCGWTLRCDDSVLFVVRPIDKILPVRRDRRRKISVRNTNGGVVAFLGCVRLEVTIDASLLLMRSRELTRWRGRSA